MTNYGRIDRQRNYYGEIRDAILYKKESIIRELSMSHPDTLFLVLQEGESIDPSVVAEICPELISRIEDFLVSLSESDDRVKQQVPEVILRVARMPGSDPQRLFGAFASSCKQFSLRSILEGMDLYSIKDIEQFIFDNSLQDHNCKALEDLSLYYKDFDKLKYTTALINHHDIIRLGDFVKSQLLDVVSVDNIIFDKVDATKSDVKSREFIDSIDIMFEYINSTKDQSDLLRVEKLLIEINENKYLQMFVSIFPDRTVVQDYMTVQNIMNA